MGKQRLAMFLMGAGIVVLAACGGAQDECDTDSNCKGDRVCEAGACVDAEGTSGTTTQTESSTSSTDFQCCVDGQFYECGDEAAMNACFDGRDRSGCVRNGSRDPECSGQTADSDSPGTTVGVSGEDLGAACDTDGDCASGVCIFPDGAANAYCSAPCRSLIDCPNYWYCTPMDSSDDLFCIEQ